MQSSSWRQALKDIGDPPDPDSVSYMRRKKVIDKFFKIGMKKLRKEGKADKDLTDHAKALVELDLTNKEYSKAYDFDTVKDAQEALCSLSDDWVHSNAARLACDRMHLYVTGRAAEQAKSIPSFQLFEQY